MFFSQWIPTFSLWFDLTKYNDRTIFGRVTIEMPITFLSPQVPLLKLHHLSKCQQSIFGCRTQVLLLAVTTANTSLQVLHPLPRKSVKIQGSAPAQTQNPQLLLPVSPNTRLTWMFILGPIESWTCPCPQAVQMAACHWSKVLMDDIVAHC